MCTFCNAKISHGGTDERNFTSSNFKKHLNAIYSREVKMFNLNIVSYPKSSDCRINTAAHLLLPSSCATTSNTACVPLTSTPVATTAIYKPTFHTIDSMFEIHTPLPSTRRRARPVTQLIGKMICLDMLPFRIVECEVFQNFISFLELRYTVCDRTTFSRTVIPDFYKRMENEVRKVLAPVETMSLTTDLWPTQSCEDVMSLTCHYINDICEHKSLCRDVIPFLLARHTSGNILEVLKESIQTWTTN
ncbi:hypothetical protein PR048_002065 [Dryococelus australis]|uniref:Uncharacterized protein n=1 Tax=Dryococelus australis TaxID=614101 RepID=A0ABQ9IJ42_9NEOP|nr:hypothetical protein PR048_002065 [Dryococelus australis]